MLRVWYKKVKVHTGGLVHDPQPVKTADLTEAACVENCIITAFTAATKVIWVLLAVRIYGSCL